MPFARSGVRRAELVAALSLATDLGLGQPQEHVLRQTLIARRLAATAGLGEPEQTAVFYVSILAWVGCISDSHEMAMWFGDDRQLRADSYHLDKVGLPMMRFMVGHVGGTDAPPLRRLTMIGRFLSGGMSTATQSFVTHCQTTGDIADRLGLGDEVRSALSQAFERWDGKGVPARLRGDAIDAVIRVVQIADDAEVIHRTAGQDAVLDMLRARRGTEFDPALVDLCCLDADFVFADLDTVDVWEAVLADASAIEPELDDDELTAALEAFADYADLKSPSWLGHSRGVAALAADAGRRMGLPAAEVRLLQRAALVHDLGVTGVSTAVWDKPGPLTNAELERVRTHPYLTERVLSRPAPLAEIGSLAALHHERMDGSGYPRGLKGDAIPVAARVLAAADVYHALGEGRPHRDAFAPAEQVAAFRDEVKAGRLDGDAVQAVLAAAGHRVTRRPTLPAGLTAREVEVLVLAARGMSNKAIGARLGVSARTIGSHLEHVYTKIGVTTRGAAAMFAMRHGLVAAVDAGDPAEG